MRATLLVVIAAIAACGGGRSLVMVGSTHGDVRIRVATAAHHTTEVIGFVRRFSKRVNHGGIQTRSVARLATGDWVVTLDSSASNIVRLAPDGATRWRRRGHLVGAGEVGGLVVGVGYVFEDTAPVVDAYTWHQQPLSVIALDAATGQTRWTTRVARLEHAQHADIVQAGALAIVVTRSGTAALDASGAVRWELAAPPFRSEAAVAVVGDAVAIVTSGMTINSREIDAGTTRKDACTVQLVDAASGRVDRAQGIVPEGHGCTVLGLAAVRDAIVVRVLDTRFVRLPDAQTSELEMRAVVLDATTLAIRTVVREPAVGQRPSLPAFDGRLGASEVAFLDEGARGSPLALAIVDAARGTVRFAHVLIAGRVTVGEGFDSYAQVEARTERDRIVFEGSFVGSLRVGNAGVRSDVREVDACDAQHGVECFGTDGKTETVAPSAALIGTVRFHRASP